MSNKSEIRARIAGRTMHKEVSHRANSFHAYLTENKQNVYPRSVTLFRPSLPPLSQDLDARPTATPCAIMARFKNNQPSLGSKECPHGY
jgi:hypothetical protein